MADNNPEDIEKKPAQAESDSTEDDKKDEKDTRDPEEIKRDLTIEKNNLTTQTQDKAALNSDESKTDRASENEQDKELNINKTAAKDKEIEGKKGELDSKIEGTTIVIKDLEKELAEAEKKDKNKGDDGDDDKPKKGEQGENGFFASSPEQTAEIKAKFEEFQKMGFNVKICNEGGLQYCAVERPKGYEGNMNPMTMDATQIEEAKKYLDTQKPGASPTKDSDQKPSFFTTTSGPSNDLDAIVSFSNAKSDEFANEITSNKDKGLSAEAVTNERVTNPMRNGGEPEAEGASPVR